MKRKTLYLTGGVGLVALITAAGLAYATVWNLAIFGILFILATLLGLVLALIGFLVWRRTKREPSPRLSRVSQGLLLAGLFLSLQATYFPLALELRSWETRRAEAFIDRLIPKLEAYKRQHNDYPASLDLVLTGDETLPRLLQLSGDFPFRFDNRQYYILRDQSYGFRFYVPDGFIGFHYAYCCGADGGWTATD